jgi:hypothetical protein
MKKIMLFLLTLISLSAIAQKKPEKTPEEKARKKTTEMVSALKLNKDQESRLLDIHVKAYQSIEKYEAKKPGKALKKKQKDIVHKMRDAEYKKILTPEQYNKYLQIEKEEDRIKALEKAEKKKKKDAEKKSGKLKKKSPDDDGLSEE